MKSQSPTLSGRIREACAELERRCQAGESYQAEPLLAADPILAADPNAALEVIYTEFVLREEHGESTDVGDWLARFPQYRAGLEQIFQVHATVAHPAPDVRPPGSEGAPSGYQILEELGRGGMGVVYKARQRSLGRLVALKVIRAGAHASPEELVRFHAEAEAAARLQHPHIVQIFEVGEDAGHPFLALEFVEGSNLEDWLARSPLLPREAAALVETLARAVQHAHDRGVVHRDLKPANVLLRGARRSDGEGDAGFTHPSLALESVKITDFGLAKRMDVPGMQTQTGVIVGTPSYMAPEQAAGNTRAVGPLADVYALGAILYECLTGRPPFLGADLLDTLQMVRFQDVVSPSVLQPKLPRDLETITRKCLEKEPARRYGSAAVLAEDLRRFLNQEAILARPTPAWERLAKWARRKPAVAALAMTSLSLFIVGFILVAWQWREAHLAQEATATALGETQEALTQLEEREGQLVQEKGRAEKAAAEADEERGKALRQLEQAEQARYLNQIALTQRELEAGDLLAARTLLELCPWGPRHFEYRYLWGQTQRARALPRQARTVALAVRPDGQQLACLQSDGLVVIWDPKTKEKQRSFAVPLLPWGRSGSQFLYSPDGRHLARSGAEPVQKGKNLRSRVELWDTETGLRVFEKECGAAYPTLAFSPDGRRLACGQPRNLLVWSVPEGKEVANIPSGSLFVGTSCLGFSTDGTRLFQWPATMPNPGAPVEILRTWEIAGGKAGPPLPRVTGHLTAPTFSPDGRSFAATVQENGTLVIWNLATGEERLRFRPHKGVVREAIFSPDSQQIATYGADGRLILWDAASGQEVAIHRVPPGTGGHIALGPKGTYLAAVEGSGRGVVLHDLTPPPGLTLGGSLTSLVATADGRRLATVGGEIVKVWDTVTGRPLHTYSQYRGARAVAMNQDGRRVAQGMRSGQVLLWEINEVKTPRIFSNHTAAVECVALSADGRLLVTGSLDGVLLGRDLVADKPVFVFRREPKSQGYPLAVAFSRDGKRLAASWSDNHLWFVDTDKWQPSRQSSQAATHLTFAPDGKRLAAAGPEAVALIDTASAQTLLQLKRGSGHPSPMAYSPDGRRLATGGPDQTLQVWDTSSGQQVLSMPGHRTEVRGVAFTQDGQRLISASGDGTVRFCDATAGPPAETLAGHGGGVEAVAYHPRGHRVASVGRDGHVRCWDLVTGRELYATNVKLQQMNGVAFSSNGKLLVCSGIGFDAIVLDADTGRERFRIGGHRASLTSAAFAPDGRRLVTAAQDRRVKIWDLESHTLLVALPEIENVVTAVSWSPDGERLATGGHKQPVRLWNATTGERILECENSAVFMYHLTFSPDGSRLAGTGADSVVRIWDARSGKNERSLLERSAQRNELAFRPDGKVLAAGGQEISLWDVATGRRLRTLEGHGQRIPSVAFSPDGRRLVSGSHDATVKLWDVGLMEKE